MAEPPRRLTIRAHIGAYTGYHAMLNGFFQALTRRGVFVSIRKIAIDEQWGKHSAISKELRSQIVECRQPEPFELLMAPPFESPTPDRKTIAYTMYESSELPPKFVNNLNGSELVIVPCSWCAESFAESGVRVPIEVVSLGYDPAVFKPSPIRMDGPLVFGVAGRTKHCSRRKSIQEAIDLFLKTFPTDEGVRLHVKVHPDDDAKSTDHRVKIFKHHFEPYELAHWIHGLTAFITLSRGEGFGLWPLQCMASGRPVIGAKFSGQADFMNEANSFVVKHRVVDAVSGESNVEYLGQWADLDYKSAAQHMLSIRKHRAMAAEIGEVAAKWVAPMTWDASADKLIAILEKVGAL